MGSPAMGTSMGAMGGAMGAVRPNLSMGSNMCGMGSGQCCNCMPSMGGVLACGGSSTSAKNGVSLGGGLACGSVGGPGMVGAMRGCGSCGNMAGSGAAGCAAMASSGCKLFGATGVGCPPVNGCIAANVSTTVRTSVRTHPLDAARPGASSPASSKSAAPAILPQAEIALAKLREAEPLTGETAFHEGQLFLGFWRDVPPIYVEEVSAPTCVGALSRLNSGGGLGGRVPIPAHTTRDLSRFKAPEQCRYGFKCNYKLSCSRYHGDTPDCRVNCSCEDEQCPRGHPFRAGRERNAPGVGGGVSVGGSVGGSVSPSGALAAGLVAGVGRGKTLLPLGDFNLLADALARAKGRRPPPGYKCAKCGDVEHYLNECPLNTCFKCGGRGHIATNCTQPRKRTLAEMQALGAPAAATGVWQPAAEGGSTAAPDLVAGGAGVGVGVGMGLGAGMGSDAGSAGMAGAQMAPGSATPSGSSMMACGAGMAAGCAGMVAGGPGVGGAGSSAGGIGGQSLRWPFPRCHALERLEVRAAREVRNSAVIECVAISVTALRAKES